MSTEAATPQDLAYELKAKEVEVENAKRSGVGTRLKAGRTRGKGSMVITFEQFDETKPETLPKDIAGFLATVNLDPTKDESTIVSYLISGFNTESYVAASDPLAEYVEDSWPADSKTQFRLVVRNYSRGAGVSIEDAVALIKPGFIKQFTK